MLLDMNCCGNWDFLACHFFNFPFANSTIKDNGLCCSLQAHRAGTCVILIEQQSSLLLFHLIGRQDLVTVKGLFYVQC